MTLIHKPAKQPRGLLCTRVPVPVPVVQATLSSPPAAASQPPQLRSRLAPNAGSPASSAAICGSLTHGDGIDRPGFAPIWVAEKCYPQRGVCNRHNPSADRSACVRCGTVFGVCDDSHRPHGRGTLCPNWRIVEVPEVTTSGHVTVNCQPVRYCRDFSLGNTVTPQPSWPSTASSVPAMW